MGDANEQKADHIKVANLAAGAIVSAPGATINDKVYNAFRSLQSQRGVGNNSQDLNLGCAEHYMYARYLAGLTGDPAMLLGGDLYDGLKRAARTVGAEKFIRKHDNPTLPPNKDLVLWGREGAKHGLQDFAAANPGKEMEVGPALKTMAGSMMKIVQDKLKEQFK